MSLNICYAQNQYLSYGAGIGSTGLICHLYDTIDQFKIIFVNHGGDYPETYDYLDYIKNALKINITELKPNIEGYSNLYEYLFSHDIAPNRVYRFCTDKAKIRTIRKFCEHPFSSYMGITFDEKQRAINSNVSYETLKYPLVDARIDKKGAIKLIQDMGLKVPRRSCCWFCFNTNWKELDKLKRDYPDLYKARQELYLNEKVKKHMRYGQCELTVS